MPAMWCRRSFLGRGAGRSTRAPPQGQRHTVSPDWEEPPGWRPDVSESGVGPGIIQGQDVRSSPPQAARRRTERQAVALFRRSTKGEAEPAPAPAPEVRDPAGRKAGPTPSRKEA